MFILDRKYILIGVITMSQFKKYLEIIQEMMNVKAGDIPDEEVKYATITKENLIEQIGKNYKPDKTLHSELEKKEERFKYLISNVNQFFGVEKTTSEYEKIEEIAKILDYINFAHSQKLFNRIKKIEIHNQDITEIVKEHLIDNFNELKILRLLNNEKIDNLHQIFNSLLIIIDNPTFGQKIIGKLFNITR
jgi:hypothetical protein